MIKIGHMGSSEESFVQALFNLILQGLGVFPVSLGGNARFPDISIKRHSRGFRAEIQYNVIWDSLFFRLTTVKVDFSSVVYFDLSFLKQKFSSNCDPKNLLFELLKKKANELC